MLLGPPNPEGSAAIFGGPSSEGRGVHSQVPNTFGPLRPHQKNQHQPPLLGAVSSFLENTNIPKASCRSIGCQASALVLTTRASIGDAVLLVLRCYPAVLTFSARWRVRGRCKAGRRSPYAAAPPSVRLASSDLR